MKLGESPPRRRPLCTIAAWLLPALGGFPVNAWMNAARQHPHGLMPGLDEMIYGTFILAVVGVASSILAFVRRERWRWATTPIWLAGGAIIGWFGVAFLRS